MVRNHSIVIFFALWLLCLPIWSVNVVFRYDDLTLNPNKTDQQVVALFSEMDVPLSIAVIPCDSNEQCIYPTDSVLLTRLLSANFEIALHGLTHQNIRNGGEFGALDQAETCRRIHKGKQILESVMGKPIRTFIPPFNAINAYVPSALLRDSIQILSAHLFNHERGNIQYFPETLGLLMKQKGIWKAAKTTISRCHEKDAVCVVMFHAYDLSTERDWQQLRELLAYCKSSQEVNLYTFSSLSAGGISSNYRCYRANQLESGLQKWLLPRGVLHTTFRCVAVHVLNALLYALVAIVCGVFCSRKLSIRKQKTDAQPNEAPFDSKQCLIVWIGFGVIGMGSFLLSWYHILGPLKLWGLVLGVNGFGCLLCLLHNLLYSKSA